MLDVRNELKQITAHLSASNERIIKGSESLRRARDALLKSEGAIERSKAVLDPGGD